MLFNSLLLRNKCIALRLYDTFTDILLVYVFAGNNSSSELNGAKVRQFLKLANFLGIFFGFYYTFSFRFLISVCRSLDRVYPSGAP